MMNHFPATNRQRSIARSMRSSMTGAELKLWNELRARRLMGLKFRRQVPFGKYVVDFACPEYKLIIEVDGSAHGCAAQAKHDKERTLFLESTGWKVIRFWNDDVLRDIDGVCSHILAVLTEKGVKFT